MRFARRKAVPQPAQPALQSKTFPAPVRGWITAENLAASGPGGAQVLENWFPTQTGIRMRGGSPLFATIDEGGTEPVRSMMAYVGGTTRELFAADETQIFDITTPADEETAPAPVVSGQMSGYYSELNFATTGGNFMLCVNGTDDLLIYDGTVWIPVAGTAIYGIDYDAESAAFTVGETLTGGTSGATGTIVRVTDDGSTGTIYISNLSGNFQNDETITDSATGSATANGTEGTALYAAITGTATSALSHINSYRNRLFFVEAGTMNVKYLAVDSIGGALGTINMAGTFQKGGAVYFTATWSLDSGAGLDDKFVVVSTEGEVAVFEGSDPSTANTWNLVGVYEIPPPLGIKAVMRAGGDLIIGTVGGMVPISAAVSKDMAALSLAAVSRAIEPDWVNEAVARRSLPWEIAKWPDMNAAYVNLPVPNSDYEPGALVVNIETGAWAKYTGWDTRCFALHNNQLYFGTNTGTIHKAEQTGFDGAATAYLCKYVGSWDHLKYPGVQKTIKQCRAIFRTANAFLPQLSGSVDYAVSTPSAPDAALLEAADAIWDSGLWDESQWDIGAEYYTYNTRWVSIGKTGFVFAPQVQVTVGGSNTPTGELSAFDTTYEAGSLVA